MISYAVLGWNHRNFKQLLSNTHSLNFGKSYPFEMWEVWNKENLVIVFHFSFTLYIHSQQKLQFSTWHSIAYIKTFLNCNAMFLYIQILIYNQQHQSTTVDWNKQHCKQYWGWVLRNCCLYKKSLHIMYWYPIHFSPFSPNQATQSHSIVKPSF